MGKKGNSWPGAVAKWFGLQVAGKAVGFALGTPLVTGAIAATLAYIQGLPLAWGFMTVVVVAAGTATLLNQSRQFMLAYSCAACGVAVGEGHH